MKEDNPSLLLGKALAFVGVVGEKEGWFTNKRDERR
jgi:hypothetical protein